MKEPSLFDPVPEFVKIETLELGVETFKSVLELDYGIVASHPRLDVYRVPETLAYRIAAAFKVPAKVLQDNRVIASWPDGLWQTIKAKLGLAYRRKEVRANEAILFPTVDIPDRFANSIRIAYDVGLPVIRE